MEMDKFKRVPMTVEVMLSTREALKQIADTFVRDMEEERAYRKACEGQSGSEKDDL